uniref:Uncharacterized protein n=1 Tax=Solanum lycopersicum TaxID=4081 RepID=A0A494G9Y5_SOLLC
MSPIAAISTSSSTKAPSSGTAACSRRDRLQQLLRLCQRTGGLWGRAEEEVLTALPDCGPSDAALPSGRVDRPVVIEAVDPRRIGQQRFTLAVRIAPRVVQDIRLCSPVAGIPVVDTRGPQLAIDQGKAARVIDVIARGLLQHGVKVGTGVGAGSEVRAADRGAVDRIMDAHVLPDRVQDAVFSIVERQAGPGDR